jgi:hypothetical protein
VIKYEVWKVKDMQIEDYNINEQKEEILEDFKTMERSIIKSGVGTLEEDKRHFSLENA